MRECLQLRHFSFSSSLRIFFFTLHILSTSQLHSFKTEFYPSGLFKDTAGNLVNYLPFSMQITLLFSFTLQNFIIQTHKSSLFIACLQLNIWNNFFRSKQYFVMVCIFVLSICLFNEVTYIIT